MRKTLFASVLLFAIVASAIQPGIRAQTPQVAITGVSVVDVAGGRVVPGSTVVIAGNTIAGVTSGGRAPAGARVVDGRGKFLVPGLWDMHAHMEGSGSAWLPLYVANGVTGIRDMGSDLDLILKMRDDTASGRTIGPRIFAAGPILDDAPGDWPYRMRVKTAEDGRAAVQLLKRRGVDLIKVHDHTPRDAFFAIAGEAKRQSLPLAGHVPMTVSVQEAVDAGQGDIEHLDNQSLWHRCSRGAYQLETCRSLFEMLSARRIWQTPTLLALSELASVGTPASQVPARELRYATRSVRSLWAGNQGLFATPEVIRAMRADAEVSGHVVADMARLGVPILTGCDTMIAGFCVHEELALLVRGGMSPLAALQTATINPARYFGIQASSGQIAPGFRADLVLLDANPLADMENIKRIRAVVANGRLLDRSELDHMLEVVETRARQE